MKAHLFDSLATFFANQTRGKQGLASFLSDLAMQQIGERVRSITGSQSSLEDFTEPLGDPGLFGPNAMVWRVHADFTAMMVGGLSSLMVQSLHPRALAAVWDHSDFRHNLKGRLGRTAYFVAATTYGGEALAKQTIARVNRIHDQVKGMDQQGRPYVANEPLLLKWVHLVEVASFLTAYQHLAKQPLSMRECDQYMEEMTTVGHMLGAQSLPTTWFGTQQALLDYRAELSFDARAKEIIRVIENYPTEWTEKPFMDLVLAAAFDVMPAWARECIHHAHPCELLVQVRRLALLATAEPVQWMLNKQGVAAIARQRVAAQPTQG